MNKKIAFIISVAFAFLGILVVSTFGVIPENMRPKVLMSELSFKIDNTFIKEKEGEKYIEMHFKANNNSLDLYKNVVFAPSDTTNVALKFSTDQPSDKVSVSSTGIVTIYDLSLNSFDVFVESDDGSRLKDVIVIRKPQSNTAEYNDNNWTWG